MTPVISVQTKTADVREYWQPARFGSSAGGGVKARCRGQSVGEILGGGRGGWTDAALCPSGSADPSGNASSWGARYELGTLRVVSTTGKQGLFLATLPGWR